MTEPISFFPSGRKVPMVANTLGKRMAKELGIICPACDLRAAIKAAEAREALEAREAQVSRDVVIQIAKTKKGPEKPAQGE
jgi:hypothetical protein